MTNANDDDEASTNAQQPRKAASLFVNIHDEMNRLSRIIEGVFMAAGDISDKAEQEPLRELLNVANQKIGDMKAAMEEAREMLEREQPERKSQ